MLTHLQIRDFAIVDAVELELARGFTALTGETGAGKSILVDALLLAVGGRADSGAVRHGAERAEVTATFDVGANAGARAWLDEQQVADTTANCVLRRSVGADGRSRAYVNGQSMPVQALRALGELLVDVHGQLEFQSLGRRSHQRDLLDECGGLHGRGRGHARRAIGSGATSMTSGRPTSGACRIATGGSTCSSTTSAELEALDPQAGEHATAGRGAAPHGGARPARRRHGTGGEPAGRRRQ